MALTLLIHTSDSAAPRQITFDSPRVVIGRGASSDLCLPDPSVSHRHASIRQRGSDYIVVDEGSTNGTYVGPVKLSSGAPRMITSGDRIRVGRVLIETQLTMNPPTAQGAVATREIALGLVAEALAAQGENSVLTVRVVGGTDEGKALEVRDFQRSYVIGRVANADLVLQETDASRRHVSLQRRGDQLWLQDLGSKNGTQLEGEALVANQAVVWPAGTTLQIGSDTFEYSDPLREALREFEQLPDETVSADDAPKLSSSEPTQAAPVRTPESKRPASRHPQATRGGWSPSDVLVALLALAVLGVSALGLYWLLGTTP